MTVKLLLIVLETVCLLYPDVRITHNYKQLHLIFINIARKYNFVLTHIIHNSDSIYIVFLSIICDVPTSNIRSKSLILVLLILVNKGSQKRPKIYNKFWDFKLPIFIRARPMRQAFCLRVLFSRPRTRSRRCNSPEVFMFQTMKLSERF